MSTYPCSYKLDHSEISLLLGSVNHSIQLNVLILFLLIVNTTV